jgi:hypothetical protein
LERNMDAIVTNHIDDSNPLQRAVDATAEGARARALEWSRSDCPYVSGSEEAHEWLEGFDGRGSQGFPLVK